MMFIETAHLCAITGLSKYEFHNLKRLTFPNLPSARQKRFRKGATAKAWAVEPVITWLRRTLYNGISADTENKLRAAAKEIAT